MKILPIVLVVTKAAMACPDGFTAYGKSVCVQEIKPEGSPDVYKVSDEEPPRHPEPAWQRGKRAKVRILNRNHKACLRHRPRGKK